MSAIEYKLSDDRKAEEWAMVVQSLDTSMKSYQAAVKSGDQERMKEEGDKIP